MTSTCNIWAVLPIKDLAQAKQRLSPALSPQLRRGLAAAMAEDVLAALAGTAGLAGILVMTDDSRAMELARKYDCAISTDSARSGHTAVVAAAARKLVQEGRDGMLVVPGDIPRVTSGEFSALIEAHAGGMGFSISPARDECGSNAVICTPPTLMPLTYGNDSYLPHLATARARGLEPVICPLPGIGLDIDHPEDLALFLETPSPTRAWSFLEAQGLTGRRPPGPAAGASSLRPGAPGPATEGARL